MIGRPRLFAVTVPTRFTRPWTVRTLPAQNHQNVAIGLIGDPMPFRMRSGAAVNRNS